ncbi:TonB-dependent receptor [Sphingobium sp. SA916]|uniref:TonB-dependent receptor n=1 Tax=Sphingobium sp. SA916 TaxID=1851207 RepID=UPI000CA6B49B|nr:TonB-dependent receptor [Sphingobium sp. SA916]PNP98242.1 hypothetical protein A8G00_05910 [Sphingobium sp. SA916]
MRLSSKIGRVLAAGASAMAFCAGGVAGAAEPDAPSPAQAGPGDTGVEVITVTARHRAEKLQEVPIAVTALTERDLAASGNSSIRQMQRQVPSLQILGFNPRNITIQIRGLGTTGGAANSGTEPGVGIYVDGVYHARPSVVVFDTFDVANVNVLRGPQGTLFGKNTVAGAIEITSQRASYEPELLGEVSYGNYDYGQIKLAASGPLGDSGFAVRVAGMKADRNGTVYNSVYRDDWQDHHNQAVRGELAYRNEDESFTARLNADYNDQNSYSAMPRRGVLPKLRADGSVATARGYYDRARDAGYVPPPIDAFARRIDVDTPFTINMQTGGASLTLVKKLLGDHSLTSITAWRFWDWNPSIDSDGTGAAINIQTNLPTAQRQWSQELRIASPGGGAVDYTAGLYYFWQRTREVPFNTYGRDAAKYLLGAAFPSEALNNFSQTGLQLFHTKSYSAFANATWHVDERFDLTGGIRYTYEKRSGRFESVAVGGVLLTDPVFSSLSPEQLTAIASRRNGFAPTARYDAATEGGRVSGTVNALYRLAPGINLYAGYSRGFKSAGINLVTPVQLANGPAPVTFDPEIVDSFEIGLKTDLFHNAVTFNLAAFRSDDKGYQANQGVIVQTGSGPIARYFITNAGKVRTQGVEMDVRARWNGLSLTGAATYNDAKYRSYTNAQCPYLWVTAANGGICDISGRQIAGVSKFVYTIAAEYAFAPRPILGTEATLFLGGDYNHRTGFYGSLNTDPFARVPGYGLASAYAGIRSADNRWELRLWGRNLFDKQYFVNASVDQVTTYSYNGTLGDPCFYGATLRMKL